MSGAPQRPRHSTVRVTGADGTTYQGDGEGLALAMRDLGRTHRAGESAAAQGEARWRVTPAGEAYLAGWREATGEGRPRAAGAGRDRRTASDTTGGTRRPCARS
jgi:hypothetical protein